MPLLLADIPQSKISLDHGSRQRLADTLIEIETVVDKAIDNAKGGAVCLSRALKDALDELRNGGDVQVKCMQAARQLCLLCDIRRGIDDLAKKTIRDLSVIIDKVFVEFANRSINLSMEQTNQFCETAKRILEEYKKYQSDYAEPGAPAPKTVADDSNGPKRLNEGFKAKHVRYDF